MTLRQDIVAKIATIRAKAAADKIAIQQAADAQIAELQAFIDTSPPLLGQDFNEVRNTVSQITQLMSK